MALAAIVEQSFRADREAKHAGKARAPDNVRARPQSAACLLRTLEHSCEEDWRYAAGRQPGEEGRGADHPRGAVHREEKCVREGDALR